MKTINLENLSVTNLKGLMKKYNMIDSDYKGSGKKGNLLISDRIKILKTSSFFIDSFVGIENGVLEFKKIVDFSIFPEEIITLILSLSKFRKNAYQISLVNKLFNSVYQKNLKQIFYSSINLDKFRKLRGDNLKGLLFIKELQELKINVKNVRSNFPKDLSIAFPNLQKLQITRQNSGVRDEHINTLNMTTLTQLDISNNK